VRQPHISASLLNADFARLGEEVRRAVDGRVDSVHVDVMDGHFVKNITIGPLVVEAIREHATVPVHSHLMISEPQRYASAFAEAGSDLIVFHVEADDEPDAVIRAIRAAGRAPGLALNPETPADAVLPFLERIDLLLVMTVHPGWGGQGFMHDVLPKLSSLRGEIERRGLSLPIGVDGGVNLDTIGPAHAAGADVLVTGSALYREAGDLRPAVDAFRAAAIGRSS
jgi:ribulose-phosphate 3-epimerase